MTNRPYFAITNPLKMAISCKSKGRARVGA